MTTKTDKVIRETWKSRIVGYGDVNPEELLANPLNWRIHPKSQQDALSGVLSEVGWVQAVVVNKTTGCVVDGHLRVSLALSRHEPTIPAVLVELTPEEEKIVLATIDPIAAMAVTDKEQLGALLENIASDNEAVQELITSIADEHISLYKLPEFSPQNEPELTYDHVIEIRCGKNDLDYFHATLMEWSRRPDVTVNVS